MGPRDGIGHFRGRFTFPRAVYVSAAFAVSMAACAPVDAEVDCAPVPDVDLEFAALVDQAEAEIGPLPIECVDQVHGVQLVVDESEMPDVCHREGRVLGCTAFDMNGYPHVWVVDCQADPGQTMRHERLHTLLTCIGQDDPRHTSDIWDRLGVR